MLLREEKGRPETLTVEPLRVVEGALEGKVDLPGREAGAWAVSWGERFRGQPRGADACDESNITAGIPSITR